FFRMRPEDVYTRFFRHLRSLTLEMAEHLSSAGYDHEMAFVATAGEAEHEQVVASASYYVDASTGLADVAYMVDPGWQRGGLAPALQGGTMECAGRPGGGGSPAEVLGERGAMRAVPGGGAPRVRGPRARGGCGGVQLLGCPAAKGVTPRPP